MKKVVLSIVAAVSLLVSSAFAGDAVDMSAKKAKAAKVAAPAPVTTPSPWELALGASINSDYNFRGISQSNRKPSFWSYIEPRYNISSTMQLYAGIGYETIKFPNNAKSEVDFYAGFRPTFGAFAFDFGYWYYYYPGGSLFNGLGLANTCTNGAFFNGGFCNTMKSNVSFSEWYGKVTYTVNEFAIGLNVFYDPSWLNSGAKATYASITPKYTVPSKMFAPDWGMYVSGELGRYWLGTTDAFYGTPAFPNGIKYPDYTTWNLGVGITYKQATLDLRYYDTNLSKANCNVLTGDQGATFSAGAISPINPSGLESKWCSPAYIAKLAIDFDLK
jgi:hypothetical protein